MIFRLLLLILVLAALLFIPAGRLDWPEAWAFILGYSVFLAAYSLWVRRYDPEQLKERSRTGENTKTWDKMILGIYTALLLVLLIVCGLDGGRFGWAPLSTWVRVLGWLAMVAAAGLVWWTASVNTFLSRTVRIQEERGQRVITDGPYRYVRHPMYTGVILFVLSIPAVLGSGWGMAVGVVIGVVFVIRTALEDRTLRAELPGYKEYAQQTRYRLLPRIW